MNLCFFTVWVYHIAQLVYTTANSTRIFFIQNNTHRSFMLRNMSCFSGGWLRSESGERSWGVNTCGLILPLPRLCGRILHVLCTLTHNAVWEDIFILCLCCIRGRWGSWGSNMKMNWLQYLLLNWQIVLALTGQNLFHGPCLTVSNKQRPHVSPKAEIEGLSSWL